MSSTTIRWDVWKQHLKFLSVPDGMYPFFISGQWELLLSVCGRYSQQLLDSFHQWYRQKRLMVCMCTLLCAYPESQSWSSCLIPPHALIGSTIISHSKGGNELQSELLLVGMSIHLCVQWMMQAQCSYLTHTTLCMQSLKEMLSDCLTPEGGQNLNQALYWWSGMTVDIKTWCPACLVCASHSVGTVGWPERPPLTPIPVAGPFHRIGVDVLKLPWSRRGHSYCVVFTDYLTKWPEVFATRDQNTNISKVACGGGHKQTWCNSPLVVIRLRTFIPLTFDWRSM